MFLSEMRPLHHCRRSEVCRCGSESGEASSAPSSRCAGLSDTPLREFCFKMDCQCVNIAVSRPDIVRHCSP